MVRGMAGRWFALLVMTRLLGAGVAIALLAAHRVTAHDELLIALAVVYTGASLGGLQAAPALRGSRALWVLDAVAGLALIWWSGDWRSPFYVLALTALVLPVTTLRFRSGVAWGVAFAVSYGVVGVLTERLGTSTFADTVRLETAATHFMVPVLVSIALAYASSLLARLTAERERAEHLAVQAERQRIAWELHDSAKQRVHAAHLVISSLPSLVNDGARELVDHALAELRAAAADMDTSVAELRMPLEGRPVDELVRRRAAELAAASRAGIEVAGSLPPLAPGIAAHSYRIVAEALTNAVRHAQARMISVRMDPDEPSVTVTDDGCGLPAVPRPGSHGLQTMRDRADTIGARLDVRPGTDGRGTAVRLLLPTPDPRRPSQ
jgi:signal transduction histidine kinase